MGPELIRQIAIFVPAVLLSLSVHEFAHAWVATRLGDPTPGREGRLTLNPTSHIDPIGTLLFPALLIVTTGSVFGWARPVRFEPANFRRDVSMRRGAAYTAIAGPLSNVLLAFVSALLLGLLGRFGLLTGGGGEMGTRFLVAMFHLNVLLAVFNALPLPPLDGSYLLPRSMDDVKEQLARFAPLIFLLIFFGFGSIIIAPMQRMLSDLLTGVVGLIV